MRRITAPTLVLELHSAHEAHFGAQAPLICSEMFNAQPRVLQGLDAGVFRTHPQTVADAVLPFLCAT